MARFCPAAPPRPAQARCCPAALSRLASAASACPSNLEQQRHRSHHDPSRICPYSLSSATMTSHSRSIKNTLLILAIESHSLLPTDLSTAYHSLLFKRTVSRIIYHNKIQQQNKTTPLFIHTPAAIQILQEKQSPVIGNGYSSSKLLQS